MTTRVLAWRRTDEDAGHSLARVERRGAGWLLHGSEVIAGPRVLLACSFRVEVDDAWATRAVEVVSVAPAGERRLLLSADGDRRWTRDGAPDPALDGCVDVDVAATPLTNTLPIRRLGSLAAGEEVVTPVAWVDVPSLRVTRVEQTYRRLDARRWRYSDASHGAFELTVDDDGLVVEYTGMAVRVAG